MLIALVLVSLLGLVLLTLLLRARGQRAAMQQHSRKLAEDLERLQRTFQRFAPPDVVDQLASKEGPPPGQRREVAILFCDIQGFTATADRMDPALLVEVLNGYFDAMSAAVAEHHGLVSKFIGDGMMVLFGAVNPNPWQGADAARAALAMRAALVAYNTGLRQRGIAELRFGIGIHKGPVVAGFLGGRQLTEFTVIGDTVNVASRVESLTRKHGCDILITREVRDGLDARFRLREMPPTEVKGKSEAIVTWALDAFDG